MTACYLLVVGRHLLCSNEQLMCNFVSSTGHLFLLKISLKKLCKKVGTMSIDIRKQLTSSTPSNFDNRMFKLLMRCQQDIGILRQQLGQPMPLIDAMPLQQRLNELNTRQQFYKEQLSRTKTI